MKNLYFPLDSDCLTTLCPFCGTSHIVTRREVENFGDQKVLRFECTCDCAFHQRICKTNPKEINFLSAVTRFDFKAIRYKLQHQLACL